MKKETSYLDAVMLQKRFNKTLNPIWVGYKRKSKKKGFWFEKPRCKKHNIGMSLYRLMGRSDDGFTCLRCLEGVA